MRSHLYGCACGFVGVVVCVQMYVFWADVSAAPLHNIGYKNSPKRRHFKCRRHLVLAKAKSLITIARTHIHIFIRATVCVCVFGPLLSSSWLFITWQTGAFIYVAICTTASLTFPVGFCVCVCLWVCGHAVTNRC